MVVEISIRDEDQHEIAIDYVEFELVEISLRMFDDYQEFCHSIELEHEHSMNHCEFLALLLNVLTTKLAIVFQTKSINKTTKPTESVPAVNRLDGLITNFVLSDVVPFTFG